MTANEIYNWEPIAVSKEIYGLMEFMDLDGYLLKDDANELIETRSYIEHSFDGERSQVLYSVWFKGKPVMICQTAGRGGRDHRENFITDSSLYKEMVAYARTLMEIQEDDIYTIDPNESLDELRYFYGNDVLSFYDPSFTPKYKEGDIVRASVIVDHLKMAYTNKQYIETRCKIQRVNPKSPSYTYHMVQLDRRWENEQEKKARGFTGFKRII